MMYPSSDDIVFITSNVLDAMVNVEAAIGQPPTWNSKPRDVAGCVQISGAWQGTVILQSTERFARQVAAHMLAIAQDDVNTADIQDAMAEITNMIGGNIKSQFPGPSFLSLASVETSANVDFHLARSKTLNDVTLTVENEPLRIVLCENLNQEPAIAS